MANGQIHYQVVGALALAEGSEEAHTLLDYASSPFKESLQTILDRLKETPAEKRVETMHQYLRALRSQEAFSGIAEIHPAWLLEALKKESPRVIGVILRHLPSKHVRYLLEHLPQRIVMRLPKLIEAFYVPTGILNLIRQRFERHFVPMRISHQIAKFEFHHLYYLKIEELECLFRELGLSELALSLGGSSRQILKIVLNRFNVGDAKNILSRIKRFSIEEKWFFHDAKYSVLDLSGDDLGADSFLKELGLQALAKAFAPSDAFFFESLKQKLSPDSAYLFKRYLEEQLASFAPDKSVKRKAWVMEHVQRLSEQRKIDFVWSGYFTSEAA